MKYLVNRETKEHTPLSGDGGRYSDLYFDVVEADDEGWIPWSGGECPLPDGHKYNFTTDLHPLKDISDIYSCPEDNSWDKVTAYRPILSETSEKVENYTAGLPHSAFWKTEQSVFDRLKSAIAASESIPGIIAEIDAMLPEGYCVAKVAK